MPRAQADRDRRVRERDDQADLQRERHAERDERLPANHELENGRLSRFPAVAPAVDEPQADAGEHEDQERQLVPGPG